MNFLNKKKNIWLILAVLAVIAIVIGFVLPSGEGDHHGHEFWWSGINIFFAAFGFVGCVVLILFAKKIVNRLLERKEDYYD